MADYVYKMMQGLIYTVVQNPFNFLTTQSKVNWCCK